MKKNDNFQLGEFYSRVDRSCSALLGVYEGGIKCRKGCDICCTGVPVRKAELDYLVSGLRNLGDADLLDRLARVEIQEDGSGFTGIPAEGPRNDGAAEEVEYRCVFLSGPQEGHCLVYPWRPLICRVHGLPLLYPIEEYDESGRRTDSPETREYRLSVCDLNLEGMEDEEVLLRGYVNMEDLEQELEGEGNQS